MRRQNRSRSRRRGAEGPPCPAGCPHRRQDVGALCRGAVWPAGLGTALSGASRFPHLCVGVWGAFAPRLSYPFFCSLLPSLVPRPQGEGSGGSGSGRVRCRLGCREGGCRQGRAAFPPLSRLRSRGAGFVGLSVTQPVSELSLGPTTLTLKHHPDVSARSKSASPRGWPGKALES